MKIGRSSGSSGQFETKEPAVIPSSVAQTQEGHADGYVGVSGPRLLPRLRRCTAMSRAPAEGTSLRRPLRRSKLTQPRGNTSQCPISGGKHAIDREPFTVGFAHGGRWPVPDLTTRQIDGLRTALVRKPCQCPWFNVFSPLGCWMEESRSTTDR